MTATIVENDLDTDLFEALDFESPVVCEFSTKGVPCDNEADYTCTHKCCAMSIFACEDCLFGFHKRVTEYRFSGTCNGCGHLFKKGEFPYIVTRLK